jgi:hypothetical protein
MITCYNDHWFKCSGKCLWKSEYTSLWLTSKKIKIVRKQFHFKCSNIICSKTASLNWNRWLSPSKIFETIFEDEVDGISSGKCWPSLFLICQSRIVSSVAKNQTKCLTLKYADCPVFSSSDYHPTCSFPTCCFYPVIPFHPNLFLS